MLAKRIIPCLDIKDGRTVKGVNFVNLQDAGSAVELAKLYSDSGSDELVFLDITATVEKRKTLASLVEQIALNINIPFTVGGGIKTLEDASRLIGAGADKLSINSSAIENPKLIETLATRFGSQAVVLAVDARCVDNEWLVYKHGGRTATSLKVLDWALEGQERGAGEILLTSMNNDGTKNGFALELTNQVSSKLSIPVIASGGAGKMEDFLEVFTKGKADAALAASIFHFHEIDIFELKRYLHSNNIPVRLV